HVVALGGVTRDLRHRGARGGRVVERGGGHPRGALARRDADVRDPPARGGRPVAHHASDPALSLLRPLPGGRVTHLTVVSYNIHRGVGLDRRHDLDRIADVIAEVSPDVVGLQEAIRENGMPHADQAAYLAARLRMTEIVMGETRTHGAGIYGNAVLTRLRVLGSGRCDLSREFREPRGCLRVDLDVRGTPLHVFN